MTRKRTINARPDPATVARLLSYEAETGALTWKRRTSDVCNTGNTSAEANCQAFNRRHSGRQAFTANRDGYHVGSIFGRMYAAHQIAWVIAFGEWPDDFEIDHINGDRSDNRIENLRKVKRSENTKNKAVRRRALPLGVYALNSGRYFASISEGNQTVYLGSFDEVRDAYKARSAAERRLGFHPNHGRILAANPPPKQEETVR